MSTNWYIIHSIWSLANVSKVRYKVRGYQKIHFLTSTRVDFMRTIHLLVKVNGISETSIKNWAASYRFLNFSASSVFAQISARVPLRKGEKMNSIEKLFLLTNYLFFWILLTIQKMRTCFLQLYWCIIHRWNRSGFLTTVTGTGLKSGPDRTARSPVPVPSLVLVEFIFAPSWGGPQLKFEWK